MPIPADGQSGGETEAAKTDLSEQAGSDRGWHVSLFLRLDHPKIYTFWRRAVSVGIAKVQARVHIFMPLWGLVPQFQRDKATARKDLQELQSEYMVSDSVERHDHIRV